MLGNTAACNWLSLPGVIIVLLVDSEEENPRVVSTDDKSCLKQKGVLDLAVNVDVGWIGYMLVFGIKEGWVFSDNDGGGGLGVPFLLL